MNRDLSRLFRPTSIAVVGGGAWCANVVEQCLKMDFPGRIWPVHPSRFSIGGIKALTSIDELPGTPDAAFIGVNRHATIETVGLLARSGAGGAVCFASGFSETQAETGDGTELQNALLEAAGSMPVLGPNCYGFINYLDGALLWPDQHGGRRVEKGVAILMQSSNLAINITMQTRGLPVAYIATTGNQAQTGLSQIAMNLLSDERVTALGLHIEGIGDLRAFETLAAEARKAGKPIVVMNAGKSEQAQIAAMSHTASLSGSDKGAEALFRRLGIARVDSLPEFLETLKLLHFSGSLPSSRIASMSCSGGEACLMADTATGSNITFPEVNSEQKARLREILGPLVAIANPLDYHTFIWRNSELMGETFAAMLSGTADIGCIIADFPRLDRCDGSDWDCVISAGSFAARKTGKPVAMVSTLQENMPETISEKISEAGMIPLQGLNDALAAIEAAAMIGQAASPIPDSLLLPGTSGNAFPLTEAAAKKALSDHGLEIPVSCKADIPEEAAISAAEIGFPVVLKGEGAAHKTEAGLVRLSLKSKEDVISAARQMSCDSYLIEKMVTNASAELLVGVIRDPIHGFAMTIGAGGVLTELLEDFQTLLLPASEREIRKALESLRIYPLLAGYRGKPAADMDSIVRAIHSVQDFVRANAEKLEEVEINPVICTSDCAVAADAFIRMGS